MVREIQIALSTSYSIYVGAGLIETPSLRECCLSLAKRFVVISDSNVAALYGEKLQNILSGLSVLFLTFPAGEIHKTREVKQRLEDQMLENGCNRDTCIIALGGGVVSDMAGFVAATYCRGIPMVLIPTTLLAMVDASMGGKTAVNTQYGKNMIGCFYQPKAVFIDINFLGTLSPYEIDNGLAEILKHALIQDRAEFDKIIAHYDQTQNWLLRDREWLIGALTHSILIKKNLVEKDEQDLGIRQLLNFGHTLGHAIEQLSHYTIPHGQAVAIGILLESYLSSQAGLLPQSEFNKIIDSLKIFHFSLKVDVLKELDQVIKALKLDKKSEANVLRSVFIEKIGLPVQDYTRAFNREDLEKALNWYHTIFCKMN